MPNAHLAALLSMKATFEGEQDWVAVGHVEYLIDRFAAAVGLDDRRILMSLISRSLH